MQEHNNQDTILDALTSYWTDRAKSYSAQNIAEMNDWRKMCIRDSIGPVGIVIADALLGEITAAMAVAVGQSPAKRILVPVNHCDNYIVGVTDLSMAKLIEGVVTEVRCV